MLRGKSFRNGRIKQFLTDVTWGELDALIIDTPPGTSDELLAERTCGEIGVIKKCCDFEILE